MGNIRNPYDVAADQLSDVKAELLEEFMADDGVICDRERGIIVKFEEAAERIRRTRGMERGFALLMKQEGIPTRYTDDVLAEAGLKIEPIGAA